MDDQYIIDLFFARSETAIEAVQQAYGLMCRSIVGNLLGNEQDVEECLNDTWHALWNAIPPQRPESLKAYTAKIARNLAMSRLTYLNAQKRQAVTVSFDELSGCLPAGQNPEDILAGKELGRQLARFLAKLDGDSRDMFLRRYWFFDSIEQIAKGFGMSETRVTTKLHRVRKKLKHFLEKEAQIYVG